MAMHGHADEDLEEGAWDEEGFREALRKHGLDDADIESVFSMLPHRQRIEGEDSPETQENLEFLEERAGLDDELRSSRYG